MGRSRSAFAMLKIAAFAPMPRASESTATSAKPGAWRSCRMAYLKSVITGRLYREGRVGYALRAARSADRRFRELGTALRAARSASCVEASFRAEGDRRGDARRAPGRQVGREGGGGGEGGRAARERERARGAGAQQERGDEPAGTPGERDADEQPPADQREALAHDHPHD